STMRTSAPSASVPGLLIGALTSLRLSVELRIVSSMWTERVIDCCQQRGSIEWLAEEAADTPYDRALLVTRLLATGYEEYAKIRAHMLDQAMKLDPFDRWHADVGYQAIDIGQPGVDQLPGRRVRANQVAARLEKFAQ